MPTVTFDLHKLGWKSFEDLVNCIFTEVIGPFIHSFARGPDEGRDAAFYGRWKEGNKNGRSGTFTIQCKHTSSDNRPLKRSIINKELPKIRSLYDKGLADNYVLVTNHSISAKQEASYRSLIKASGPSNVMIFGESWISSKIASYPRLRRLVPRLYGLGDLTQIITHQAYRQWRSTFDAQITDLSCFVPTESYRNSAKSLMKHGFVLIVGGPGTGKTTIANILALSASDEWNLQPVVITDPKSIDRVWNPDDPGQLLWVDDAFGATQFDSVKTSRWNSYLPHLLAAVSNGHRIIFTSRDYIYRATGQYLKASFLSKLGGDQAVVNVGDLTDSEKQLILYNHLKLGKQPTSFRTAVKGFLVDATAVRSFNPEVCRRFGDPSFTRGLVAGQKSNIVDFFQRSIEWIEDTIKSLATDKQAALALIFIHNGRLEIPVPESERVTRAVSLMRSNIGDVKASLLDLDGSFVRQVHSGGGMSWRFRHPTISDAVAAHLAANPEFMEIYLDGASVDTMLGEITCGVFGIRNTKMVVPERLYGKVLARLSTIPLDFCSAFDEVVHFLANRCSSKFLAEYFTTDSSLGKLTQSIGYPGNYDNALRIIRGLHEGGYLREDVRCKTVNRIIELSQHFFTFEFHEEPISGIFSSTDLKRGVEEVTDVVLGSADLWIHGTIEGLDRTEDPEAALEPMKDAVEFIRMNSDVPSEIEQAEDLLYDIENAINESDWHPPDEADRDDFDAAEASVGGEGGRSGIFEDVDE